MKPRKSKVNLHGSSERQESKRDLVDGISTLPDSILGLILSFLPTKEAVGTSILSRRWKFAWVTVQSFDFCYDRCSVAQNEGEDMKFIRFVNRVLLLHGGFLNKFRLDWSPFRISSHASSWIDTAIARNVHDLSLFGQFDLPISVFSCASLQSLKLFRVISLPATDAVCLPRLEILTLDAVDFQSEEAFEKLISACPMLNYLYIDNCRDDRVSFTYIISSTSLRHLKLALLRKCSLKLKASALEYLEVYGCIPEVFEQKSLTSLVAASFGVYSMEYDFYETDFCNLIVEAVRSFDHAKTLNLAADVIRHMSCATISLSTEFKRLVKLVAGIYGSSLLDFIRCSCNLEELTICQLTNCSYESDQPDHSKWITPVEVPRCLSNSLKKVRLDGYKGLEDEREMICYMLRHGSALELMQINYDSEMAGEQIELCQEICQFSRKSPGCEIQFSGKTSERKCELLL